jgi:hypothetical protein
MEVFKRYNSFHIPDLKEAAHRFNTYITLTHQGRRVDKHKSA